MGLSAGEASRRLRGRLSDVERLFHPGAHGAVGVHHIDRVGGQVFLAVGGGLAHAGDLGVAQQETGGDRRITSYNVCYTKLLRKSKYPI